MRERKVVYLNRISPLSASRCQEFCSKNDVFAKIWQVYNCFIQLFHTREIFMSFSSPRHVTRLSDMTVRIYRNLTAELSLWLMKLILLHNGIISMLMHKLSGPFQLGFTVKVPYHQQTLLKNSQFDNCQDPKFPVEGWI